MTNDIAFSFPCFKKLFILNLTERLRQILLPTNAVMSEQRGFFRKIISPLPQHPADPCEVFAHLPVLTTQRLILRPMRMSDAPDVFAYSRDPEVARHVLWEAHRSLADSRAYLRFIHKQYRDGAPSSYGIVLKETGHLVGTIGFMWYSPENQSAEVGYSLARWLWGQGLMPEALQAVLDMSFSTLRLHRVEAMHETSNPASGRVMAKCGMQHEGTLRERVLNKGKYTDVDLYAILLQDWQATQQPSLADRR